MPYYATQPSNAHEVTTTINSEDQNDNDNATLFDVNVDEDQSSPVLL